MFRQKAVVDELNCLVFGKGGPESPGTVVWLHGLGDTGDGWRENLKESLESGIRIVAPNAPIQKGSFPLRKQAPRLLNHHPLLFEPQ